MEKPPTEDESSAEAQEAPDELEARLRELAEDYAAAFRRNPTEEGWRMAQLLFGISEAPGLRHALHVKLLSLITKPEALKPVHKRWTWVDLIPLAVRGRDGDPEAVARDLISYMPGVLRAEYKKGYPTNEAELEEAVARVLRVPGFKRQVAEWHTEELDVLKLGRAVLRGLDVTENRVTAKDRAKDLLKRSQWEAWTYQRGED